MKRLCTICARGGSKGVKNKNSRDLLGKPLLVYSILQAQSCGLFEDIAVSSDSDEILDIAREWGATQLVRRPMKLAGDSAPKIPVIQHCVIEVEERTGKTFGIVVDLDATSPLRDVQDIHEAVRLLERHHVSNVITGTPARHSPYFNMVELTEGNVVRLVKKLAYPITRRQDVPACYDMNASIYVWRRNALLEGGTIFNQDTLLYEMPAERSLDIDSELDFELVAFLMARKGEGT